jgi:integrase
MISANQSLATFLASVYVPSRLDLSDGAIEQMRITIRLLERWAGRSLSVYDLTEDLVRRFLTDYCRHHAPATVNSKRCQILALWQLAYDEEILERPPRRKRIRRATDAPAVPESWTPKEVGRILESSEQDRNGIDGIPAGDWWRSLLLVLYDSGERRGAAVNGVEPDDLSLDGGWVVFRRTKTRRPRWSQLHPDTVEACRVVYDAERQFVWPWPFSREALEKRFRAILKRAGVRYGRGKGGLFHKLRRTSGTLVEAAGGDGAKHLGNTRSLFERHYCDPRFLPSQLERLPRPE